MNLGRNIFEKICSGESLEHTISDELWWYVLELTHSNISFINSDIARQIRAKRIPYTNNI